MKVLLTGHKGYIGAVATDMFLSAGHDVTGLDTDLYEGCDFAGQPTLIPEILMDIRDVSQRELDGFDAVVHLAGLSNDPLGNLDSDLTYDINYHASVRLAERAKRSGVKRFIFASSCSTYGASGDDFLTEAAAVNPVTPYGVSKVRVEQEVGQLAGDDFSPTFMRNATAYGVSPRLRLDIVLNDLVATAYTSGEILIKSDGTPWRPITHIRDIISAMLATLEAPREVIHNEIFNVGRTEENYQIRQLAEIVADVVPDCRITYASGGGPDKRCYRVSCEKIRQRLPLFRPQWTARKGAEELYEAYRTAGLSAKDVHAGRYLRIRAIQSRLEKGELQADLHWKSQGNVSSVGTKAVGASR